MSDNIESFNIEFKFVVMLSVSSFEDRAETIDKNEFSSLDAIKLVFSLSGRSLFLISFTNLYK